MKSALAHPDLLSYKLGLLVKEFKVVALREVALADGLAVCDNPERIAAYWRANIATDPHFNSEVESFYVVMLNTRRKPKGHYLVAHGIVDQILVHPREVFRAAIIAGASAIVLMHNLCAATHKLCYVKLRVMCSCLLLLTRVPQRKECYA